MAKAAKDGFTLLELEDKKVFTILVQLSVVDGHKIWSARLPDEQFPDTVGPAPLGVLRNKLCGYCTDLGATAQETAEWLK